MVKVLFICYGNICRSPMAEMIFKHIVKENNKEEEFYIYSKATSREEIANNIYPLVKDILLENNIDIEPHYADQMTKEDYNKYDYIIVMEQRNKIDVLNILGKKDPYNKIHLLLEYTKEYKDILDPWYTRNFRLCFEEIYRGCESLYNYIIKGSE